MPENEWCEIPYRCLVPQAARGLLVAGRCISNDFTAQASYRITPNCRTLGEAAAVACRLAKDQGLDVSAVDGRAVRAFMRHPRPPARVAEGVGGCSISARSLMRTCVGHTSRV